MFDAHLTQGKVAARIGITPKHLSSIVTGKALPSVDVCRRFAAAVGADAEQLWAEVANFHLHDGNQRTVRPGRDAIDGSADIDGMGQLNAREWLIYRAVLGGGDLAAGLRDVLRFTAANPEVDTWADRRDGATWERDYGDGLGGLDD
jgi:DNA-binding XRE family transcriptional regulator